MKPYIILGQDGAAHEQVTKTGICIRIRGLPSLSEGFLFRTQKDEQELHPSLFCPPRRIFIIKLFPARDGRT